MAKRYSVSSILILFCIMFAAAATNAQWVKDGVPAGSADYYQSNPKIVQDGANGVIVVWNDVRNSVDYDIYGNRITADGIVLGGAGGVPACTATGNQSVYGVVYDGAGSVIVVWNDQRDGYSRVFAQKVDTTGVALWTPDGINLCDSTIYAGNAGVISDSAGGVIVVWSDSRSGSNDIFAQRVDGDGNLLWGSDGIGVCTYSGEQYNPALVSDGSGGAIIAWEDYRVEWDVYAQRIDAGGNLLWDTDAVPVCTAGNYQGMARLAPSPSGGAFVLWSDYRSGYEEPYVQRIDPDDGSPMWTSDGIPACELGWYKFGPQLVEDASGGVLVVWYDNESGYEYPVYGQHIDSDGNSLWGSRGKMLISSHSYESDLSMTPDGAGGAIVTGALYPDDSSPDDIYAQRVDHDGNLLWGPRGTAVCAASQYQYAPVLVTDGFGGAFFAWEDQREETGGYSDIYCQRIGSTGFWGHPEPEILSCLDLPEDQGGWVRIKTRASLLDAAGGTSNAIMGYNVWRRIPGGGGPLAASASASDPRVTDRSKLLSLLSDPATAKGVRVHAADALFLGLPEGDWESVGFWFATCDTLYNIAVPTKNDSTEAGTPWETFIVTAHTATAGVFVTSAPDSGYSVDNLAPGMTGGFAGMEFVPPPGLRLSWTANTASDLWKYDVYYGDNELFVPDETNLLGSTDGTEITDGSWVKTNQYFYKLIAVDRHGNESPAALLRPEDIETGTMLQNFTASLSGTFVEISWRLSEVDEGAVFHVLRSSVGSQFAELYSAAIEREGLAFSVVDRTIEPGSTYRYRVDVADEDGRRPLFETQEISTPAMALTLHQNHPNPFNPTTTIGYYLPADASVTLEVYDSSGRLVTRLYDEAKQARGPHSVEWHGLDASGRLASSGVYFYRLTIGKETISKKMVLLR